MNVGDTVMLYFAYGSNMSSRQMAERCPGAEAVGHARLPGYALVFDRRSKRWGGYVADIVEKTHAETWGVLWRVTDLHLETLDRFEGVASGAYRRISVDVEAADGQVHSAVAYQVISPVESGPPSPAYADAILQGAREHGLPDTYRRWLEEALASGDGNEPEESSAARVDEAES